MPLRVGFSPTVQAIGFASPPGPTEGLGTPSVRSEQDHLPFAVRSGSPLCVFLRPRLPAPHRGGVERLRASQTLPSSFSRTHSYAAVSQELRPGFSSSLTVR